MYNSALNSVYSPQINIDRINNQISELEKMRSQFQQQVSQPQTPTNLTQNFQLAPTNRDVIRYAGSLEEVNRDMVIGDTPYFSKDMSVVWIKNTKGEVKTYELTEIVPKDEKDLKIEFLMAQIEEMKKGMIKDEPSSSDNDEPVESKKPANVSSSGESKTKSKQSYGAAKANNK